MVLVCSISALKGFGISELTFSTHSIYAHTVAAEIVSMRSSYFARTSNEVGSKFVRSWAEVRSKLRRSSFDVRTKWTQSSFEVGPRIVRNLTPSHQEGEVLYAQIDLASV